MVEHLFRPGKFSSSGGTSGAFFSAVILGWVCVIYSFVSIFAEQLHGTFGGVTFGGEPNITHIEHMKFANPLYIHEPGWRTVRHLELLGLTRQEADFGRRLLASTILGALIGLERRAPNRPAGVRTMALVSLGACLFTISSMFAFEGGTQEWDASRVSAALPSGVGFLGGAVIYKHGGNEKGSMPEVMGITTACSIWLSCAVGVCCGGGLYFVGFFGVAAMVAVLRYGPRSPGQEFFSDESDAMIPEAQTERKISSASAMSDEKTKPLLTTSGSGGERDSMESISELPHRRQASSRTLSATD
eukprot:gnl/MRDRNA2_/MRDRNA2_156461_c0_seq1.p1 gnl/MRDRNA2_/MRDRNA2_156461_c0~~gnl/MRDRNA2_/MRDRNA2_156461_c0_seq1.p1  ORF type:complete len:302 (-),score=50.10 gnl/MRDRNA2_/MRDRNA2_156461_c0_seq1:155-1060(-)